MTPAHREDDRIPGDLPDVAMQILTAAGSGVVGTYATYLSSNLYRAVFRDGGPSMTPDEAHDVARRAINKVYPDVLSEDQEPVRESLGFEQCAVTFGVEGKEYWARWSRSWGRSKPAQVEVGFDRDP